MVQEILALLRSKMGLVAEGSHSIGEFTRSESVTLHKLTPYWSVSLETFVFAGRVVTWRLTGGGKDLSRGRIHALIGSKSESRTSRLGN